jgi:UDPglucose 6-dehydrogenase
VNRVSVVGQGKVGLVLSACLVHAGHSVIGTDVNEDLVRSINSGTVQTDEPGVLEKFRASKGSMTATVDIQKAVRETELTFVIVPTPSNTLGGFSLRYVKKAFQEIGTALRGKNSYHVVALVSTVLPGSSDLILIPLLEEVSGRKAGDGWGYCYNPVFIALGEVVHGMESPDYVLIGEFDEKSGDRVQAAQGSISRNQAPVARMKPIEAEIAKIASNTHETMRVSFANMLFSLCTELPGANVDRITGALSHRMGKRFFKGAVPYGGPCWPRDNVALAVFMDSVGVPSTMPRTVHQFNLEHGRYVLRKILELSRAGETVGILGLAYKPGTPVVECAFGVDLANWLEAEGRRVVVWDPLAGEKARQILGGKVFYASSGDQCLEASQVVVLVNPLKEIERLDWGAVGSRLVIDCWRCLSPVAVAKIANYRPLGSGPETSVVSLAGKIGLDRLRLLTE